jgi:hypothetical protein
VVPTFRWDTIAGGRKRVGGGLRVYVDGDWFSSGDGEQLAVVLRGDPSLTFDSYDGRVSGWGADPIWTQLGLAALDSTQFNPPAATTTTSALKTALAPVNPAIVPTPMPPLPGPIHLAPPASLVASVVTGMHLPDVGPNAPAVTLVTFNPQYNPDRGLWFFDLELTPGLAYMPFVRLALARFQANSITNEIALSKIVVADVAQVVPDRTATLTSTSTSGLFQVELAGMTGANVVPPPIKTPLPPGGGGLPSKLRNGGATPDLTIGPYPGYSATQCSGRVVEAEIQTSTTGGDFGWTPIAAATRMSPYVLTLDDSGVTHFFAKISAPAVPSGTQVRVVIREKEQFTADGDGTAAGVGVIHTGKAPEAYQERVVYTDVLTFPS